jgi:hypothetical protein
MTDTLVNRFGVGIHTDVSPDDYYHRVLGECNKSALDMIDEKESSPFHYRHWVDADPNASEERLHYSTGRAYHCALLEPERFTRDWIVQPDFGAMQSSKNRDELRLWRERNADKSTLAKPDHARVSAMVQVARDHPINDAYGRRVARVGDLIDGGKTEVTLVWIDPDTGLHCKARMDLYSSFGNYVIDPKSTIKAAKEHFARAVKNFRYHVQAVHYADGLRVLGLPLKKFWFLCQEKEPPYAVAMYCIGAASESRGFELRQRDMRTLAMCLETDRWPSYNSDQAAEVNIPAWGMVD